MVSRDLDHAPLRNFFRGYVGTFPGSTHTPNLKFVSLAVTELLVFNANIFTGSHDIQGLAATKRHRLNYELL